MCFDGSAIEVAEVFRFLRFERTSELINNFIDIFTPIVALVFFERTYISSINKHFM